MPKVMAETLTKQSLQLDYAALPYEERQQLEQVKADAKLQWLHTDSLAFKFWEATEKYLNLESLKLSDRDEDRDRGRDRDRDRGANGANVGECLKRTSALCLHGLSLYVCTLSVTPRLHSVCLSVCLSVTVSVCHAVCHAVCCNDSICILSVTRCVCTLSGQAAVAHRHRALIPP